MIKRKQYMGPHSSNSSCHLCTLKLISAIHVASPTTHTFTIASTWCVSCLAAWSLCTAASGPWCCSDHTCVHHDQSTFVTSAGLCSSGGKYCVPLFHCYRIIYLNYLISVFEFMLHISCWWRLTTWQFIYLLVQTNDLHKLSLEVLPRSMPYAGIKSI